MQRRSATALSLQALARPITLASVVLLLLNDHVLKVLAPSALTGKVSDFAGRAPDGYTPDPAKVAAIANVDEARVAEWLGERKS